KTVQARILAYAQEIGWSFVPRDEAERRRGFDLAGASPEERARKATLFFGDLLHAQVRAFNPKYKEAGGGAGGRVPAVPFGHLRQPRFPNRAAQSTQVFFCGRQSRVGHHAGRLWRSGS